MKLSVHGYSLSCGIAATALVLLRAGGTAGFVAPTIFASRSSCIVDSCHSRTSSIPQKDNTSIAVKARKQRTKNDGPFDEEGPRNTGMKNVGYHGFGTILSLWTALMVTSASVAGATTTSTVSLAAEPSTTSPVAVGAQLFQANCAGCHGGGMNFIKEKKTLKKDALEKYLGSTDPMEIQKFVQKGMPHKLLPFAREFTEQEYGSVASYVSDQAVNEKW